MSNVINPPETEPVSVISAPINNDIVEMIAPPLIENNPVLNNPVIEEQPVLQNSVSNPIINSISENTETELPKGMEEERKENIDLLKTEMNDKVFQIEINKIKPNPYQPRREFDQKSIEELAASINEYGILEPLIVTRHEIETPNGVDVEYQLIAGERRFRASKYLGLKTVPAIVKKVESDVLKLELALVENVQREDLSSIAKAKSYAKLISEFGYTQEMVGLRVGKSRESIANTLRLLQLPFEAQRAIEEGRITESHARALLLLPNMEKQRALLGEILTKQLSSREAELIARQFLEKQGNGKPTVRKRLGDSFDPLDLELREKLEEVFGTKVLIKRKGETGEISIHFDSKDELEGLLNKMSKLSEKRVSSTADKLAS
jgi:ParB family chromosome partitioning protein